MMAEEILTKRGKEKFAHNGFLYVFDKTSEADNELKFWRCEQKNRCKARLHTKAGEVMRELNNHSHEASAAQLEGALVKTKIKKKAEETLASPTVVVNECLTDISQASLAPIPNRSVLRKIIRRKRNSVMNAPINPTDLQQLFVPQPGVQENVLLCDSEPGTDLAPKSLAPGSLVPNHLAPKQPCPIGRAKSAAPNHLIPEEYKVFLYVELVIRSQ